MRSGEKSQLVFDAAMLKQAYSEVLPVSAATKADLVKLCQSGRIPSKYHEFYSSLKASSKVRDCLSQPDCTEENPVDKDFEQ